VTYIGKGPIDRSLGLNEKDTFTGDGSTVAFDLSTIAPSANAIEVFIDNVRQEPGSGKAYTFGVDGSGDLKRITFSAAPANLAEIYVINSLRTQITETPPDNTITSAKIVGNAVTGAKIAMGSDAQGDVLFYGGTDYERLAAGTSGQFLKTQGAGADPIWGTVSTDPTMGGDISGTASNAQIAANAVGASELANNAVDTAAIVDNAVTGAKIAMTSDAQGDVLFYGGTDYERLAAGTSGYFLKTLGSGADPAWAEVPAGAPTGGGTEKVFYENENSVDTDYTLTTNYNAVSAGPVTVASGVTVTIPAGQAWVIV
tara:strand:- start:131 stop:1072 length:942 start_codon:yes stop_codon:yes gene_type:complete